MTESQQAENGEEEDQDEEEPQEIKASGGLTIDALGGGDNG